MIRPTPEIVTNFRTRDPRTGNHYTSIYSWNEIFKTSKKPDY